MYKKIDNIMTVKDEEWVGLSQRIKSGELIIYPTDTVYGLGAIISNEESINNIYFAKSRSFNSPLIALLSSVDKVDEVAEVSVEDRELLNKLAKAFWPGALTVILRKKDYIPEIMVSGGNTIGVRIPNLDLAIKIIDLAGGVLATTSANISGEPSPKSYEELSEAIKSKVNLLIDGGKCKLGEVSTIIDLTKKVPKILRKGAITTEEIEKIIGKVE
ncbi:L-threonylcarbamoyladenylate synthase [Fusobacterium massiliense]|jgi:sua5/yciO/yrdC/ywlC family protein|uniref:L-threonylcarbamoyladenylate synthase n=1 Tax=Fusobacterium massiliense TaxID=1852365 RepID=UPI000B0953B1|nr:L-threonylcarbamoyladenylate synthase [Fusobacterium massiliense]